MENSMQNNPRRHFLSQVSAAAASLIALSPIAGFAQSIAGDKVAGDADAWMKSMKGKHKQIFHAVRAEIQPMLMARNFLDSYEESYGVKPGHVNVAIGFHAGALSFGLNDAMWDKYALGKASEVTDPVTKAPATRNVFATGSELGIDALQKRGVVFLMCNTSLRLRTKAMATSLNVPYDTLYSELSAARLAGVILVPSLVVTLNRAQERGFTYIRAS